MPVTKGSSWKSFDLNCYTSAKMSWKNAREWSFHCIVIDHKLYYVSAMFVLLFKLLLTIFHLGVLHDGFCTSGIGKVVSIENRKSEALTSRLSFLSIYMVYRLHLYILYIFVSFCVRRFSCSVGSKVKVLLLSALVSIPCWPNIHCICLLEIHIRIYRESFLWISVGIFLLKVSDRNSRTIGEVL